MEKKTFTLFWLTGKSELVTGYDASTAMNNAGIGAGALRAMDFYAEGDKLNEYTWDERARSWEKINIETE